MSSPETIMVVAGPTANLYSEPDTKSEMVTQVLAWEPVTFQEAGQGWWKVAVPDGYVAWIEDRALVEVNARVVEATPWRVIAKVSPVRAAPRSNARILMKVVLGTDLPPASALPAGQLPASTSASSPSAPGAGLEEPAGWHGVLLPDGRPGWIRSTELARPDELADQVSAERVLATARLFLGSPYVWGGVSSLGADCSGLVYTVFRIYGITLPRDADAQYEVGVPVEKDQLAAGDLVFFSTYLPGPSHVGIYTGDDKFIHSASWAGGVITPLSLPYYQTHYLGARRLLQ